MTDDQRKLRLRTVLGWLLDGIEEDRREFAQFEQRAAMGPRTAELAAELAADRAESQATIDGAVALRADANASAEALSGAVLRLNNMASHGGPMGAPVDDEVAAGMRYIAVSLIAAGEDELADRLFDAQRYFRYPENIEKRPW